MFQGLNVEAQAQSHPLSFMSLWCRSHFTRIHVISLQHIPTYRYATPSCACHFVTHSSIEISHKLYMHYIVTRALSVSLRCVLSKRGIVLMPHCTVVVSMVRKELERWSNENENQVQNHQGSMTNHLNNKLDIRNQRKWGETYWRTRAMISYSAFGILPKHTTKAIIAHLDDEVNVALL